MDRRALADRFRAVDPRLWDGLLTAGLTLFGVGSQFGEPPVEAGSFRDVDALGVVLGLLVCLPLYWRRTRPLTALLVSTAAITVVCVMEYWPSQLPTAVLFLTFAVGSHASQANAIVGLVAVNAAIGVIWLADTPDFDGSGAVLNVVLFSAAWLAGQVVRSRAQVSAARLAEAENRAESELQIAARAVAEERLRLAQELHDVVAHSMSVIAVQAGMGAHVIDTQPERAREALDAISQTSRSTLNEMRRLLGVLRDEEGERVHAPAPELADLPRLVDSVRRAGVQVDLSVEGDVRLVPHAVELSVYRLVQEGLTNVIKHAGPAEASVNVRCTPAAVEVEIVDDGRGAAAPQNDGGGHGLLGMRERVALWGGRLEAGPRAGGGFRVTALFPLADPA